MKRQALITLINAATSAAASSVYQNSVCDLLSIQITGTFSALKLQIQGKTNTGAADWTNIATFDKTNLDLTDGTNGITAKGIFNADITGLVAVRVNVASVSGGYVTVTGSFENTSVN